MDRGSRGKAAAAKQAIVRATTDLLQDHGFESLKVKDVVEASGVARSLFYYHFDSLDAVVDYMISDFVEGFAATLLNLFPEVPLVACDYDGLRQMEEQHVAVFSYVYERRDQYQALSRDLGIAPSFLQRLRQRTVEAYEQCDFLFVDGRGRTCMLARRESEYYIESLAGHHLGVIDCWAKRRFAESPEELHRMEMVLDRLLPEPTISLKQRYASYEVSHIASWKDFA